MIAAIYARKSTEQNGVADEQKSVARQVEHARQYAEAKGWSVDDAAIFVDDGISGAEFANRPGFLRLMNALKPRPPFQVLVMSEISRLGREMIETAYALKELSQAGVRAFSYLEGKELALETATDKFLMSAVTFAAELEREKARQRTHDAMIRKARAGHVTGGLVFGYANVEVLGPDGRRAHVERRIVEEEAEVVRRIFRMCADGHGMSTIAKTLNGEGARRPRSQQGRPRGWAPSSIREVLHRELYRGVLVWNQTRKRDQWGQHNQKERPAAEHVRLPMPHLRIVDEDLWDTVRERFDDGRARYLRLNNGRVLGRPPASGVKYLLAGLLTCGACGSSLEARTRSHGRLRAPFYGCSAYHRKGSSICANNLAVPMADADESVLSTIEELMLDPTIVEEIVDQTLVNLATDTTGAQRGVLEEERASLELQLARLTEALAAGGQSLPSVLTAIRTKEARRTEIDRALGRIAKPIGPLANGVSWREEIRSRVRDWRGLLRRHPQQGQQLLRRLIVGRLTVTPEADAEGRYYRFRGQGTLSRLIAGLVPDWKFLQATKLASPTGSEITWSSVDAVPLEGIMRRRRAA